MNNRPPTISDLIHSKLIDATKDWRSNQQTVESLRQAIKDLEAKFAGMSKNLQDGSKEEINEGFGILRAYAGIIESKSQRQK